jgi:adenylate cyclase
MLGLKRIKLSILSVFLVLLTVFLSLLLATSVTIISYTYYETSKAFLNSADQQIDTITREAIESTVVGLDEAMRLAQSLTWSINASSYPIIQDKELVIQMLGLLSHQKSMEAFFLGDENGNVLSVGRILDKQKYITESIPVPQDSVFMVRRIDRSQVTPTESREYLNKSGVVIGREDIPTLKVRYDARVRPWYTIAKESQAPRWTDVYLFENNEIGITAAAPVMNDKKQVKAVIGIDLSMAQVSSMLSRIRIGTHGIPFITTDRGEIIGHPDTSKTSKKIGDMFAIGHIHEAGQPSLSEAFNIYKKLNKGNFTFELDKEPYIASFVGFPKGYGSGWIMGVVVPQNDFVGPLKRAKEDTVIMSLGIILLALITIIFFSRRISVPIGRLAQDMKKIQNFEIDNTLEVKSSLNEIAMVAEGLKSMKQGLQSFSRYVPKDLVRQLVASGNTAELGGEKRKTTILFSDIEGFTSISEKLQSEDLMIHLSGYLDSLSQIIINNKGTIDKYIGDAIMAFWGAPNDDANQVHNACYTVLRCLWQVNELNHQWIAQSLPPLPTRFGLNTAQVIVGNMGSSERMNYTIIGDGVNLASRLEALNKEYGTYALVSHNVYLEANDRFVFRPLDVVAVKGKNEGIVIYELCGTRSAEFRCDDHLIEVYEEFAQAFEEYQARHWNKALRRYRSLAKSIHNDKVARIYIDRCLNFAKNPPPADWDGVYRLTHK